MGMAGHLINPSPQAMLLIPVLFIDLLICFKSTRKRNKTMSEWLVFDVYYQIWCLKIFCLVSDLVVRFGVYYLPGL